MMVRSLNDIENIEQVPLAERGLASSTYEALTRTAKLSPNAPALSFFADAASFRNTHHWSYAELVDDITRAANAFHDLGITPGEVLAFILPNLPETHFTIWGGSGRCRHGDQSAARGQTDGCLATGRQGQRGGNARTDAGQ